MDWNEAIALLHGANWKHTKIGLERMRDFMHALGDPQEKLRYVHIAGTNGKGSACVMTQSILTAAGFRTGLYISPHLDQFNERLSIDGQMISDADLRRLAGRVRAAAETLGEEPTDFEMITAMAFCWFEEQHCELVVLEVGMGGRLDATNVISSPEVCAIMHIGLDHTEFLGDTVEKVAAEKAGILKPGADCVLYHQLPGVMDVVQQRFAEVNSDAADTTDAAASPLNADTADSRCVSGAAGTTDSAFDIAHSNHAGASTKSAAARLVITNPTTFTARARTIDGQVFDYRNRPNLRIHLLGNYQMENAMAVLDIIDCNAGSNGQAFATNFNPEINIREVSARQEFLRTRSVPVSRRPPGRAASRSSRGNRFLSLMAPTTRTALKPSSTRSALTSRTRKSTSSWAS